jgi:predicted DNA binding CopG/RHH family protein
MTPTPQSGNSEDKYLKQIEAEIAEVDDREQRGHATRPPRARGRTTPIAVRFDEFTIKRLKGLAARRNTGYQTLLKEFVVERLYEEEKRERIIE